MRTKFETNPHQMTYDEAVLFCKGCAEEIRAEGIDLLVSEYDAAVAVSDQIAYPLDIQEWITKKDYPLLYEINEYAILVDNNHTDRASWEKLLELIDSL